MSAMVCVTSASRRNDFGYQPVKECLRFERLRNLMYDDLLQDFSILLP